MVELFRKHPLYDEISKYSYEGAIRLLSEERHPPVLANAVAAMATTLSATAQFILVLQREMPESLQKIDKDILAFDASAYVTHALQQAMLTRHKRHPSDDGVCRAWLSLSSTAKLIRQNFIDPIHPNLGPLWLERWGELRSGPVTRTGASISWCISSSRQRVTGLHYDDIQSHRPSC